MGLLIIAIFESIPISGKEMVLCRDLHGESNGKRPELFDQTLAKGTKRVDPT